MARPMKMNPTSFREPLLACAFACIAALATGARAEPVPEEISTRNPRELASLCAAHATIEAGKLVKELPPQPTEAQKEAIASNYILAGYWITYQPNTLGDPEGRRKARADYSALQPKTQAYLAEVCTAVALTGIDKLPTEEKNKLADAAELQLAHVLAPKRSRGAPAR